MDSNVVVTLEVVKFVGIPKIRVESKVQMINILKDGAYHTQVLA